MGKENHVENDVFVTCFIEFQNAVQRASSIVVYLIFKIYLEARKALHYVKFTIRLILIDDP